MQQTEKFYILRKKKFTNFSPNYHISDILAGINYVKSTFQTAFTTTMLAWGWLIWPQAYTHAGLLLDILSTIKWATDYFLKCSMLNKTEFVVQVGDITLEDKFWVRPEELYYERPIITASETHPGKCRQVVIILYLKFIY